MTNILDFRKIDADRREILSNEIHIKFINERFKNTEKLSKVPFSYRIRKKKSFKKHDR
jgi:hypothetical protein